MSRPPQSVPTLTEVVEWPPATPHTAQAPVVPDAGDAAEAAEAAHAAHAAHAAGAADTADAPVAAASSAQLAELEQRLLADLQHQVELMLEVRLREALTPLLTRAADALVRDARKELATSLRELVGRAVAQEIARRRGS